MSLQCPVCRASFRENARCTRCGADLTTLMRLSTRAYLAQRRARAALMAGQAEQALTAANQAETLQRTPQARRLRLLSRWLLQMGA